MTVRRPTRQSPGEAAVQENIGRSKEKGSQKFTRGEGDRTPENMTISSWKQNAEHSFSHEVAR